ncbi:putative Ig domain-containing protein, partial [Hydrogenophaga sp.]|uniref:putative Ig domain-containing protein n=1 Tax=Hydrogenophaga sp. TaxID=1904254 RepID=UPI00286E17FB
AGVSSFFVSVPSTQDSGLEGAEAFSLSASVTGGKNADDSSTILDDGSGKVYDEQGLVTTVPGNDDRALAVTSVTVNEGSPYAVFTVSGAAGQLTSLSLANGTTAGISGLQVYNGSAWVAYTGGTVALNGSGQLLVRTALSPEQEATLDSGETFTLTATNTGGGVANGTATVRDDGTGTVFNEDGSVNTAATLDDDRAITVAGLDDVSEGSNAVFTVSMPEGNARSTEIGLALSSGTAGAEDYSALAGASAYYFDGEGLKVTLTITAGKITLPTGVSSFFVSVPSTQDATLEGAEAFSLSATVTGGKNANDSSTILDDGSGKVYDERGLNPAGPGNDDRPVTVLAPEAVVVEAPVAVVPTPETSIPHEPLRFDSTTFVAVAPNQQPQLSAEVLALIQRNATETEVPLTLTRATGFQVLVNERQSGQLELHRAIDKQFVETGAQGSIALPIDTFTHSDPAASITLAARLSDGQPLPSWVSFDPRTGTFKVVAPAGYVGELDVEVSARDNKGNEVKTKFRLTVGAKPAPAGREGLTGQLRQASKTAFAWRDAVRGEPAAAPAREAAPAQRVQRVEA